MKVLLVITHYFGECVDNSVYSQIGLLTVTLISISIN